MFLVKKKKKEMHGKQITELLDLPNHKPTRQQAGHMEGEVAPFSCFKCKKDCGDGSNLVFYPLLLQFLLPFQTGFSHQFDWTLSPAHPVPLWGTQAGL